MLRHGLFAVLASVPALILAQAAPSSNATASQVHTTCYNYFLNKDGCVYGSLDHPCVDQNAGGSCEQGKKSCDKGHQFQHPECPVTPYSPPPTKLFRRLDTTLSSDFVAGGSGVCGFYNTTSEMGACVWYGPANQTGTPAEAGWLNDAKTDNCRKQVYVQRQGQPDTVQYVPVLDACTFGPEAELPEVGCFQIFVTKALFDALKPTEAENMAGALSNLTWDWNNPTSDVNVAGSKPENSPV